MSMDRTRYCRTAAPTAPRPAGVVPTDCPARAST